MRTQTRRSLVTSLLSLGLLAGMANAAPPEASRQTSPRAPAVVHYGPDFEAEMKPASGSQPAGSLQTVVVEVRNKGQAQGAQSLSVRVFFTGNPQALGSALAAKTIPAPGPGQTEWVAFSPTVPAATSPGAYWLCTHVSAGSTAGETQLANNTHCAPLQVTGALGAATPQKASPRRLRKVR